MTLEERHRLQTDVDQGIEQAAYLRDNPEAAARVFNDYTQEKDWSSDQYVDLENPDSQPEADPEVLNLGSVLEEVQEAGMVSEENVAVGRGDQWNQANIQRLAWDAGAEYLANKLEERGIDARPEHNSAGHERAVFHDNAKHRALATALYAGDDGLDQYEVGDMDNSRMIDDVELNEEAAAAFAEAAGFDYDEDELPETAVEFHREFLGEELGLNNAGDVNDVNLFGLLADAGVAPRYVHVPLGEDTVGEEDLGGTYVTTLAYDPDLSEEAGQPMYSRHGKGYMSLDEVSRTAEEIRDEGHTSAHQNYEILLPALTTSASKLWMQNPVGDADKYQGVLDVEEQMDEHTPFDSVLMMDMGFPAIDENDNPVSPNLAEQVDNTSFGEKWGPLSNGDIEDSRRYHGNAALGAVIPSPEQAETFRDEVDLSESPEDQFDDLMEEAYREAAEATAGGNV
jgi:hypothetical protein